MIELSESPIKAFNLTLCDGEAVVRNQNRINGLIGVRMQNIPVQYHGLLAKANFTGTVINETIVWSTDVFQDQPLRLTDLPVEKQDHYRSILSDALKAYAGAISNAEEPVKKLLYAAITYPSERAVFCANDRVVLTEWGMTPHGESALLGMPYSLDVNCQTKNDTTNSGESAQIIANNESSDTNTNQDSSQTTDSTTTDTHVFPPENREHIDFNTPDNSKPIIPSNNPPLPPTSPHPSKPWWKRIGCMWWIVFALLLLLLFFFLLKRCSPVTTIVPVTPELGEDDIVLSDDSLRYIAKNRLLLILTEQNADLETFAKEFRTLYPDKDKYILSNPDTLINRITLTLPAEERSQMSETLPQQFSKYGLVVVLETIYKGGSTSNDPDLRDSQKRWYFDECSVFDAWDVTMGRENIVVAIIDDGFDLNHPELVGKSILPYNAVSHTSQIFPSSSGHGTHVAATAVGNANNGEGTSGIAPGCKLMPIQVGDAQGNMTTSSILDAVAYAIANKADVVNMSLGMSFGPFVQYVPIYVQKNIRANMFLDEQRIWNYVFGLAKKNNVTFVLAGGNENILIGLDPMQRSENTIKVSAVQPNQAKANFSNYGDMSTLSAPGVQIYNAIPDNAYTFMDGTSMAAPIVTGGCALLKSQDSTLTVNELAEILRQTGNPSPSDVGPIVNFANALNWTNADSIEDCTAINERYAELLSELEQLKREHPGCIQTPDTLSLPKNFTAEDLIGRWKSTSELLNKAEEKVVIYFTFDGTPVGVIEIVEPSGEKHTGILNVQIDGEFVLIDQLGTACNVAETSCYTPYFFKLKPDKNRKAIGHACNKQEVGNEFDFNLIRM